MKLAVSSQNAHLHSHLDPRFGRARWFILVDTETGAFCSVDNRPSLNAAQGAGIQAGKKVVESGADALITGHVGPKAFATLQAGKVTVYTGASGTVAEAVELFKQGKLTPLDAPDVEGHWHSG